MNIINIYKLDEFELFSKIRNKSFRFIKYTGENYDRLCEYFLAKYPNAEICESNYLTKGQFYTIDRYYKISAVYKHNLRFCIINNPYLVNSDQTITSLSFDNKTASDYLMEDDNNLIFGYNAFDKDFVVKTFGYDSQTKSYLLFSKTHQHGLSISELPIGAEWYAGINDGFYKLPFEYEVYQDSSTHTVHQNVNLRSIVDKIARCIYLINKNQYVNNEDIVFKPSWEEYERQRNLYTMISSRDGLEKFIQSLYSYLFESTKDMDTGVTRKKLPETMRNHIFVQIVGEFRNYFDHSQSDYVCRSNISISEIFVKYIGRREEPNLSNDFEDIQIGMLNHFLEYLYELLNYYQKRIFREGIILQDENGTIFCLDVKLPDYIKPFVGCKCKVNNLNYNLDTLTNERYKMYCGHPYILKNIEGEISVDPESLICNCNNITLPDECKIYKGQFVKIASLQVEPEEQHSLVAKDWAVVFSSEIKAQILESGLCSYGDMQLRGGCLMPGDCITVLKARLNSDKEWFLDSDCYKTTLSEVQQKGSKICYCGNVQLHTEALRYVGRRVKLVNVIPNNRKDVAWLPFFCNKYHLKGDK